jgi:selenocysteine lyase/cysteine desulfurase
MLPSQRELFNIPRNVCYLNAASWSPLPITVQDAGRAGAVRKGQPWLIDPAFAREQHERARRAAAHVISADPEDVALISSVSYGVATAAKMSNVPTGSRVLVLQNDHSSAVLEWITRAPVVQFMVDVVPQLDDGDWTAAILTAIERPHASPIALASISCVHWSDGGTVDLEAVAVALRRAGASLLVDATQAAGTLAIDVRRIDPDFLVFPTYKWLLGPYGRAFLYIAKRRQEGEPLEQTSYGRHGISSEHEIYFRDLEFVKGAAFRYGRTRSFHLAGNGLDWNGDGGAMETLSRRGCARSRGDWQRGCAIAA